MWFPDLANWMNRKVLRSRVAGACVRIAGRQIEGAFDSEFLALEAGDIEVQSRSPAFTCLTCDLQGLTLANGMEVLLDAAYARKLGIEARYRFVREEPDGEGLSRLILRV